MQSDSRYPRRGRVHLVGVLLGVVVALNILLLRQALHDAQSIPSGIFFTAGMALVGGVSAGLAGLAGLAGRRRPSGSSVRLHRDAQRPPLARHRDRRRQTPNTH